MLLCRFLELPLVNNVRPLERSELFDWSFGSVGSMMLVARDEPSETGARSVSPWVGGTGKDTSAPLEAVRRRRCVDPSWDELRDFARSCRTSRPDELSSMSLLVSLLATLTLSSSS